VEPGNTRQGAQSVALESLDLDRYRLGPLIGEGADRQVFAATDLETGDQVVLKRPHPTLVEPGQHRELEEQTGRTSDPRAPLGPDVPHLPRLIGVSPTARHGAYFGDALTNEYAVTVEERARGVPLVAGVVDGLMGHPIGLPMNLFCLYPLATQAGRGAASIVLDVLSVVDQFHKAGVLLTDLRPQNVFYSPGSSEVTIVDIGAGRPVADAASRRPRVDIHDLFLDLFRWYTSPNDPSDDPREWGSARELDLPPAFDAATARLSAIYQNVGHPSERDAALRILEAVAGREFSGVGEFAGELGRFLEARAARLRRDETVPEKWQEALLMLEGPYWTRYLFDPATELTNYRR